jgi:hypothetical protein
LKALELIENKYYDKVEVIITENIPYTEYITLYNNAHILLDQVYSYDQGYNALEVYIKLFLLEQRRNGEIITISKKIK